MEKLDLYRDALAACNDCLIACEHGASSCLEEDHVKRFTRVILLCQSCADVCALAVREMARGSAFVLEVCQLAAQACETCAEECADHSADACQLAARACRRAGESCREIVLILSAGVEA